MRQGPTPRVSAKTVARSMRTQGLVARQKPPARADPPRQERLAPDLIRRDFTAQRPNEKWCGEGGSRLPGNGEDLYSRLGFALSDTYPTAELAKAAVNMAIATRGGTVEGVIFHTDRGSQYKKRSPKPAPAGDRPIHGKSRLRLGQRRRRVVFLHPPTGTNQQPPVHHQNPS